MRRSALSMLLLSLFAGCATIETRPIEESAPPTITARFLHLRLLDPQQLDFEVELTIENPGDTLTLERIDYQLFAANRTLASSRKLLPLTLAAHGTTRATLATTFTYLALPRRAQSNYERDQPIPFAIRGRLILAPTPHAPDGLSFDAQTLEDAPSTP